jgi:hypothetical protein
MLGGAGYRMPTPGTGDLDVRIESAVPITDDWLTQFDNLETKYLIKSVSRFIWINWGVHIRLDVGISDGTTSIMFDDQGKPCKAYPFKRFDWEYCL